MINFVRIAITNWRMLTRGFIAIILSNLLHTYPDRYSDLSFVGEQRTYCLIISSFQYSCSLLMKAEEARSHLDRSIIHCHFAYSTRVRSPDLLHWLPSRAPYLIDFARLVRDLSLSVYNLRNQGHFDLISILIYFPLGLGSTMKHFARFCCFCHLFFAAWTVFDLSYYLDRFVIEMFEIDVSVSNYFWI